MGFLKDLLLKQRYPALLLVAGVIFLFGSRYSVSGKVTEPQLHPEPPRIFLAVLGAILALGSAALFIVDEDFVAYRRGCKVTTTKTGIEARFRDSSLSVDFGQLQELYQPAT